MVMTAMAQPVPWNLITKNFRGHEGLQGKIRQKIAKLERYLLHFPADSVHLQIALEKHSKKPLFMARLTLRVPSNILHSEKSAPDVITAFDDSIKALLRELESFKSALRREATWKRAPRRQLFQEAKAARFASEPLPQGAGPQGLKDLVRDLFQQHYKQLVRHVRRVLRHNNMASENAAISLDPHDVVDEVSQQAIAQADRKPRDLAWPAFFYRLIHDELRRQRRTLRERARDEISLDSGNLESEAAEHVQTEIAQEAIDMQERSVEPPAVGSGDLIADAATESPDEVLARKDLLEQLQHAIQHWPQLERDVFELYYVEGFEPDEIAMIVGQPMKKIEETITGVQERLRQEILTQALA